MFIELMTVYNLPYVFNTRNIRMVIPQANGEVRLRMDDGQSYLLDARHTYGQLRDLLVRPGEQLAEPGDEVPALDPPPARAASPKRRRAR